MRRLATFLVLALATPFMQAQEATRYYCQGEGCPTRYLIEGFEVWVSPSIPLHPSYTHKAFGRFMDTLQSQLVYMTSDEVIPPRAMNALRDSRMTVYVDDPDDPREWWPCGGTNSPGCYSPSLNRIGTWWRSTWHSDDISRNILMETYWWQSFMLHEMAHAYHYAVIFGRFDNPCITDTYEDNKYRYDSVKNHARRPDEEVPMVRHYAQTSRMEYFAELTEAYFFRGTSYPWNRVEMFLHDPDGFRLIRDAWNDPGFCQSGPMRQTPAPLYEPVIQHQDRGDFSR